MFIRIKNTQTISSPKSNLSAAIQAGANVIPVKNINDYQINYFTQLGQTGEERSEIVQVAGTPSGGTFAAGATRYPHPTDTPAFAIKYNKIVVKRSTSGTAGSATNYGTVDITPDQPFTQFEDSTAQSGYAYKTAFYNSVLDVYSSESNWITTSGYSPYSRGGLRNAVRQRIKNIPGVEDGDIDLFLNEYMEMMRNAAVQVNEDYGLGTLNVTVGAGTQEYQITDDLHRSPARVWMISAGGTVPYLPIFTADIDPTNEYSWNPRFYLPGDNTIGFIPVPNAPGTAQIIQNVLDEQLDSDDDQIPRPMKPYRTGFIDYATAMCYRQDGKDALADSREVLAMRKIDMFKAEIDPRQRMTNEQVVMVDATDFINDFSNWGF